MTTPASSQPRSSSAAPSRAEHLFYDFQPEVATTRRLLERYPDGKGSWKPDPKSRSLGELATHIANLVCLGVAVLTMDVLEAGQYPPKPELDTARELLQRFDENVASVTTALRDSDQDALAQHWELRFNGRVALQGPRGQVFRTLVISHLIHHRAQLAGYYRALGIPVPSIYGPSADENAFAH